MRGSKRSRLYRQDDVTDRGFRDRVLITSGLPVDIYLAVCTGICAWSAWAGDWSWMWWITGAVGVLTLFFAAASRL